ncbi:unnamed protein product [Urochloa humidicola]
MVPCVLEVDELMRGISGGQKKCLTTGRSWSATRGRPDQGVHGRDLHRHCPGVAARASMYLYWWHIIYSTAMTYKLHPH